MRTIACSIMVLLMAMPNVAFSEGPVYFADPALKAAVEARLGISDPNATDMLRLTDLSAGGGIVNLTGLQYATNLTSLYLASNQISDISALAGMTNMKYLYLTSNQISDISALAGMTNMTTLHLELNQISDISALAVMTNMTTLYLTSNQISDISALAVMTNMTTLHLEFNQISDISALAGMTNMTELWLYNNNISDISAVSGLTNLIWLSLANNQISDINAVSGLTNMTRLDLHYNQISDINAVSGLTNLELLGLYRNQITDISGLLELTKLGWLYVRSNPLDCEAYSFYIPLIKENNPGIYIEYDERASCLEATNLWDGKRIELSWGEGVGAVRILRIDANDLSEVVFPPIYANSFTDETVEPGRTYKYVLKSTDLSRIISNEVEVKAEVIVVLVRGYSPWGSGYDADYWGEDVDSWFEERGVTCWDASTYLYGSLTIAWNAWVLEVFINSKLSEPTYQTNPPTKINLVSHSMGGLISRQYANTHPGFVDSIFCIHTPHTGSPLADLRGILPSNSATDNLKPAFMRDTFNNQFKTVGGAQLYTLWSSNPGLSLLPLAGYILKDLRFLPGLNDGIVPVLSMFGRIWELKFLLPKLSKPAILSTDTAYTNYNHLACHKKESTWFQILSWMELDAGAGGSLLAEIEAASDVNEPNVMPLYYVVGYEGQLDSNTPVLETAQIGNSQKAYFRALVSDVNCSFTIIDPCSIIYDPCYTISQPNVTYTDQNGILMYDVNSPISGSWNLNLSTTVAPPNSVDYGLTAFEDANIALYSFTDLDWANTDANVLILATLTENSNPVIDANLTADIALPDTNTISLLLYDDGLHGDANADDGIYADTFSGTSQTGIYSGLVSTTGMLSGTGFQRTSPLSFTISSPDINFAGDINDIGVDLNANTLYDILRFTIPVNVNEPNEFLLTATLFDSNDDIIKMFSTGDVNLPIGPNTLILEIAAEDIVKHNADGPYNLSDITLSDANTGLTIAAHADYNTAAYAITDFEPLDTDGDGLSDNFELSIGTDANLPDSDYDGLSDYEEIFYDGDANSYNPASDLNPLNTDTDSDGMSDSWELYWNFDPLNDDGTKNDDDDTDGLTNLQEYQNNTEPDNADTDADGMPDGWEIDFGLNPLFFDSATDDDEDGLTNLQEYQNDTNPNDPDTDDDTVQDGPDNCKLMYNPDQTDADGDGEGDTCEADISGNHEVDLADFALLASHWRDSGCGDCDGADLDGEGDVDFGDLDILVENWLAGVE